MLQRLRREFVVITMALVGLVLVVALGSTLVSGYVSQSNMVYSALAHGLTAELDFTPRFGDGGGDDSRGSNWLTLSADVSADGTIIAKSSYYIDPDVLTQLISRILSSGESSGRDAGLHLSWMCAQNATGWRISIVDTQAVDAALAYQTMTDVVIVLVAMAALFVIVWVLSAWILRPIQKSWDSQRRFVSDASHELKTPLAVILANTQILLDDPHVPPDARTWIESTGDEAGHMKALVEDLLVLARADEARADGAGRILALEDLDFSELVDECAMEFDAVAFERGCSIEKDIEPGVRLRADRAQIARAVRALIDNATKYAARGTAASVRLRKADGRVTLTVNNASAPMDPMDLEHVFDRFWRSDRARSREEAGGFGLGLAICKSIVSAHGGTIAATSTAEGGTTFAITL
ncbi:MAG: HAMP domain-containing histidine kinase [Coriobacteriaceae bacterium]|uniref:sensor histidine kinase n=1 Tax=Tractidigestivibacter sp. TaxID=2847320 RepID=UPI002A91DCAD|nr:HAMP domain-containing sensor histidine kinase [Tractidigestivibacter sp.]MCI6274507.1 HAMP domain-containing histidine kinase [Coriobacteriaceae bacterium]MCI6843191.1 HAMP domain-containing histidine kinase [Coriobacteriaceae bacterium]MDY5272380.1 HAMP domain-containing sensor histidine kinase [Tractidigestivibacter sp.]